MTDAERSLRETTFMGWPAFVLTQWPLRLHVVPSIGGRLMGMAFEGDELCFINPALQGRQDTGEAAAWAELSGDWGFPLWGGGKTWLAPESAWPAGAPHRDLDSGAWSVLSHWCGDTSIGIELQSPVCRDTGLQLRRRLELPRDGSVWHIEHHAANFGRAAWTGGLWDVLMLNRPARVSIALADEQSPHWKSSVRPLPGLPALDELMRRGLFKAQGDLLEVVCAQPGAFKLGFDSFTGEVQADLPFAAGVMRYQRRAALPRTASYAHGHPLEVFNAPALPYFEIESHSPAITLQPGERTVFVIEESVRRLFPANEEGAHT